MNEFYGTRLMQDPPVIALDQCAISDLALNHQDRKFGELRKCLLEGVEAGKFTCPVAPETVVETCGLPREDRQAIRDLHVKLAGGSLTDRVLFFKHLNRVIEEETFALISGSEPAVPFERSIWSPQLIEQDALAAETWECFCRAQSEIQQGAESLPLVHVPGPKAKRFEYIWTGVLKEQVGRVYRQVERLLAGQEPDPRDDIGFSIAVHLTTQGASVSQLIRLKELLQTRVWEQIPVVYYQGLLAAGLEREYRRRSGSPRAYDVNDHFDLSRLAVGLDTASLILTDGKMARLCEHAGVSKYSETRVIGWNQIQEALQHLTTLLA